MEGKSMGDTGEGDRDRNMRPMEFTSLSPGAGGIGPLRLVREVLPMAFCAALVLTWAALGEESVRQWADSAVASSQFGPERWGAVQATGAPDTPTAGDHDTAWTTHDAQEGLQWLELRYGTAIHATGARIRETNNPGAVARVELRDMEGRCHEVWKGEDPTRKVPAFFEVKFDRTPYLVQAVRIYLDTDHVEGWSAIDAVELEGFRTSTSETPLPQGKEVRQWATGATASSSYPTDSWSPQQATGEPNTLRDGDSTTAWTPERKGMGRVWLELSYDEAVYPTLVRIRETFNPGAVCKVEFKDAVGKYHLGWEGNDDNRESPGYFEVAVPDFPYRTKVARIWLDTDRISGWNEIDAVELVGHSQVVGGEVEVRQWASSASASSEYSSGDGSAGEASGPPDTPLASDYVTAWAAQFPDKGKEWLELRYVIPVHATGVRIFENFTPGGIVEVELKDPLGQYHSVWEGNEPVEKAPACFEVSFERSEYEVSAVRIHLETSRQKGWEEIDAVELVGMVSPAALGNTTVSWPISEWAEKASASSEFRSPQWGAGQATGLPNTVEDGDFASAWASQAPDDGTEWLQLSYSTPVYATGLRIRETFNPGAVSKVLLLESGGKEHLVWEGRDTNAASPGFFELVFPRTEYLATGVKLFLDTARVPGWNEIDAVELLGYEAGG